MCVDGGAGGTGDVGIPVGEGEHDAVEIAQVRRGCDNGMQRRIRGTGENGNQALQDGDNCTCNRVYLCEELIWCRFTINDDVEEGFEKPKGRILLLDAR